MPEAPGDRPLPHQRTFLLFFSFFLSDIPIPFFSPLLYLLKFQGDNNHHNVLLRFVRCPQGRKYSASFMLEAIDSSPNTANACRS